MNKYYWVETDEEVKVGDTVNFDISMNPEGNFNVEEKDIPHLIALGFITKYPTSSSPEKIFDICIYRMREKLGLFDYGELFDFLRSIKKLSNGAIYNIVFKNVALYFDERYETHIKDYPNLYAINTSNLRIYTTTEVSALYKKVGLFRQVEEAEIAIEVYKIFEKYLNERK